MLKKPKLLASTADQPRYWLGVASFEHVTLGRQQGFAQACHGKCAPLARTRPGDYIVYYSPKKNFSDKTSTLKQFTQCGRITSPSPYQASMGPDFKPFRVNVEWLPNPQPVPWDAVKDKVSFAPKLRFGFLELTESEFHVIRDMMFQ